MHIHSLLVPVFYPGSLWVLAGCFMSAGSVAAFEDIDDSESDVM